MKDFIIQLPFEYKRAVLTQARTSANRPYAFIVEFNDGSRKFIKGPFKRADTAEGHVICNEVKRHLSSKYLHPIQCEIKKYGPSSIFLECEELGKADLNSVTVKRTKLEDDSFEVLENGTNDTVPDPLAYIAGINDDNAGVWIEVMVNYCFRWVFGIGDTARRNLMLQRSTGKIYSTDETGIEVVSHENIWGGKKPATKIFKLINDFAGSSHINDVLIEVERWKAFLEPIRRDIAPFTKRVDDRIDKFLKGHKEVLDV